MMLIWDLFRNFSLCEKLLPFERTKKNRFSLVLCSLIRNFATWKPRLKYGQSHIYQRNISYLTSI